MQDDGDFGAKEVEVIILDVDAADIYGALGGVVETGNQLNERRFRRARASENADRLAGANVEIDVGQSVFLRLCGIFEADVIETDTAVLHFLNSVFGADEVRFLFEYFRNTPSGFSRHRDHCENHSQHHER